MNAERRDAEDDRADEEQDLRGDDHFRRPSR
jgi:hypothetical protein